ncbi:MAG TPA: YCF48-related protein [Bacteroidia bacterium]|nr:YCF48-related protein [Bacteroidia bacterium]
MKKLFSFLLPALSAGTLSAQWTPVSTAMSGKLETVVFTSPSDGFAAGSFQYMYKTVDGGSTWLSAGSYDAKDIYFFDANHGYAAGVAGTGTMKSTTNGGSSWTTLTPPNSSSIWGTFATSASTCYFIATDKKVHKSTNSGGSFTSVTLSITFSPTDIWFTDANTGFITTQDGIIFKTTNAGGSWSNSFSVSGVQLNSIYFVNTNLGFACGTNGAVLKTTNGGTSWTALVTGTTSPLNCVRFYDALNGLAVGYGGTIIRTADGGTTWTSDNSNTTRWLYSISYTSSAAAAVIVGDSGTVLKNTNIPIGISEPAASLSSINCFPNPANGYISVSFRATKTADISPVIYDLDGRAVKSFSAFTASPGDNDIRLDVADLSPGAYLVRLDADDQPAFRKILITR